MRLRQVCPNKMEPPVILTKAGKYNKATYIDFGGRGGSFFMCD